MNRSGDEIARVLSGEQRWCVITGDCLEILPTIPKGSVGAVVTDPPWGIGEGSGTTSRLRAKSVYNTNSFEDSEQYVRSVCVPGVCVALRMANSRGLVTPGVRCMWCYPQPRMVGGFYQPAAVGMSPWGFAAFNPILFYGKDPRDGKGQNAVMTVLTEGPSCEHHPCSKPLTAMRWMVEKASLLGEVVLDPFCGSGTTGVACMKLGRRFIGIEISEEYARVARRRIAEASETLWTPAPKPEQAVMFGEQP